MSPLQHLCDPPSPTTLQTTGFESNTKYIFSPSPVTPTAAVSSTGD